MGRPHTQLFALTSIDGKISTGATSNYDFDLDLPRIPGTANGLFQYYEIESETDLWTLSTGAVMQKMFWLKGDVPGKKVPVTNVVVDSQHLTEPCVRWLSEKYQRVLVALPDAAHSKKEYDYLWHGFDNVGVVEYPYRCLDVLLDKLGDVYECDRLTLQGGSMINTALMGLRLVDEIHLVVAPLVVSGDATPSLFGEFGLILKESLRRVPTLELTTVRQLKHNYLELVYKVDYSQHGVNVGKLVL